MSSDTEAKQEDKPKLNLEVKVEEKSACERHVTVTVAESDIERYVKEAFDEVAPTAEVRGFRPGRAPRKLIEAQFKEQIADKVKGAILMDSMSQVSEDSDFSAISEPDLDFDAVTVPDEGPMTFEFDIEVRPDFDMPDWKGLTITCPVHEYNDEEVKERAIKLLSRYGKTVDVDQAEVGDSLSVEITFSHDGETLSTTEESLALRETLSFRDGTLDGFAELLNGCSVGESRKGTITISEGAPNESLRGKEVEAEFNVNSIKRHQIPALTPQFLEEIGGFESEDELYDVIRGEMERQLGYHQDQEVRKQITHELTKNADWEIPPDLLRRQARRELDRSIMELRSSGFSEDMIQGYANRLSQNVMESTEKSLKEHFILERIAEENKLEAEESDYETEIAQMAAQTNESARRVRARLEKRGQMDSLRNQIIERKAIEIITDAATVKETEFAPEKETETACGHFIAGEEEAEIPEAKHGEEEKLSNPADRT